jgi:hypothetical protein
MVVCELAPDSFFVTWALLTAVGLGSVVAMSAAVFYRYYVNPCFEDWRFKTQTKVSYAALGRTRGRAAVLNRSELTCNARRSCGRILAQQYPDPEKVRLEIIQTVKGIVTGSE